MSPTSDPIVVLVPNEEGLEIVDAVDGLRAVRYDPKAARCPTRPAPHGC